ncbi:MAG TPA: IclR family transcriptional regulator [Candidatus Polarisedimenticolia bacterium]|jgi:DNA-binding IclR family transcriptional regulator|nr:IclR family transcriptional regulator [Candidatus Polarisedimenticolia bacterium]
MKKGKVHMAQDVTAQGINKKRSDRGEGVVTGNQAVRRAIAVLKAFSDDAPEMGVTEVSRKVNLHKSTVYRLLSAFEGEGLIGKSPENGKYRLGPELIVLGEQVLRHTDVHRVALPFLRDMADRTGETVDLEVLSGSNVVTIEEIAGKHVVAAAGAIGMPWAAHATSTGKVLLAFQPPEKQRQILVRALKKFTPRTITDSKVLSRDLIKIREQGYAVSYGELEDHLIAIGLPIRSRNGDAIAAVSISGPDTRLTPDKLPGLIRIGLDSCSKISARLGYHGPASLRAAQSKFLAPRAIV